MKASTWTPLLPEKPGAEREQLILQAVQDQHIVHDWHVLELRTGDGRRIELCVSRDALRVGEPGDAVRVTVSARTLWQIAEVMGARPLTPKLADVIHREAGTTVPPITRTWWRDGSMALTRRMLEQSRAVDELVAGASGLVSGQCKDWVLCRALSRTKAANYGWHVRSGGSAGVTPGARVLQPLSTAHNWDHSDYSQGARFVSRAVKIDGMHADIEAVLADPDLCAALSHEGPLTELELDALHPDTEPAPPPKPSSPAMPAVKTGDVAGVAFVQAKNYTPAKRQRVDVVVVHSMEAGEHKSTAENVARWFAGAAAPRASAHYCVDSDSVVQCVLEHDVAWHAPGANGNGIGIEHAGYARQTKAQWLDDYGRDMLARSAELVAGICKRWSIPMVRLTVADLKAGKRGICGHVDVSHAFGKSTHTDPGPNFPWTEYLELLGRYT